MTINFVLDAARHNTLFKIGQKLNVAHFIQMY